MDVVRDLDIFLFDKSGTINLVYRDEFEHINTLALDATDVGNIVYSPDGTQLAYSYFQGGNEIINPFDLTFKRYYI